MKKMILILLLAVSVSTFIFSGYKISDYVMEVNSNKKLAREVKVKKKSGAREFDFEKLKKKNSDVIAWISIPGTDIDYPVLQTRDNDYYLKHDVNKKSSAYGAIFMDENEYGTDIVNNENSIIYGHNMGHWTSVMFGQLLKFEDNSFYEKSKKIYIYTENGSYEYTIVSIMKINATDSVYNVGFLSDEDYIDWINYCKEKSVIKCDEFDAENVSAAITLSTCMYSNDNRRFVIVAVR